jgi:predicted PolB exonuclease-like 3'-5' exonuclease
MLTVTIDCETICPTWNPSNEDQCKFPPLPYHEPVVVVMLLASKNGGEPLKLEFISFVLGSGQEEEEFLRETARTWLARSDRIVSWGGRHFDLPLLALRAVRNGVDWSFWPTKRHRYANYKRSLVHYDICDQMSDEGASHHFSLDATSKALGLPGKGDVDGADVAAAWSAGLKRDIDRYCHEDVFGTWLIYLLWARSILGLGPEAEAALRESLHWGRGQDVLAPWYARLEQHGSEELKTLARGR